MKTNMHECMKRTVQTMATKHLLRYLRALPTIRVHPELDGRTLDIVHSLIPCGFFYPDPRALTRITNVFYPQVL